MKILFITSSRLGDAVLSTGLLGHLVRTYPGAAITVACGPLAASLFEGVPGLARIIPLKKRKLNGHWIGLWTQVAGTKWDIVVDLRDSAVSRLIYAGKRYIFSKRIDRALHKVEQNAAVMGINPPPAPRLFISDDQRARAAALVPEDAPVLAVGPTANWLAKTWPPERFAALLAQLISPDGIFANARVAVFAAPGEEGQAAPVLKSLPPNRRVNMIAKGDPGTAAAALARCLFYIGNDSGLMHCAAAAGIPTLGLFGPSFPHLYRPWGAHTAYVRTPETFDELTRYAGYTAASAPCLMTSLTVDAVLNACEALYGFRESQSVSTSAAGGWRSPV